MAEWTDELKEQVKADYLAADPTPETSSEIVKEIAEGLGDDYTVNGVRIVLSKLGVYVKKADTKAKGETKSSGGTRLNKQEQLDALTAIIEANELEVDDEIISKLTGKAAKYFVDTLKAMAAKED